MADALLSPSIFFLSSRRRRRLLCRPNRRHSPRSLPPQCWREWRISERAMRNTSFRFALHNPEFITLINERKSYRIILNLHFVYMYARWLPVHTESATLSLRRSPRISISFPSPRISDLPPCRCSSCRLIFFCVTDKISIYSFAVLPFADLFGRGTLFMWEISLRRSFPGFLPALLF